MSLDRERRGMLALAVQETQQTALMSCSESFTRKHSGFQASDVQDWAALTGDTNPLHVSESAARGAGETCDVGDVSPSAYCNGNGI